MKRREFTKGMLATVTSYALLDVLYACGDGQSGRITTVDKKVQPIIDHWAIQLNEFCADLKLNAITTVQWQEKIEELYERIELQELLTFIDFEKLTKGFQFPDLGIATRSVVFPKLEGLPENTVFIKKIFGMKKDRAIIPHGHSNMVSAHLILNGEMHLRHYDKVREDGKNLIIKPTIDRLAKVGDSSSISDEKDNVHWFVANTDTAFTFDVIVVDLNDKNYDIHNLDIYAGQDLKNGTLSVPMLDVDTALKKYGKQHH